VFPGGSSFPYVGRISRTWKRLCRRAKLTDFRLHDLRHAYASFCASGGRPHQSLDGATPDQAYFTALPFRAAV
jgi:integrase